MTTLNEDELTAEMENKQAKLNDAIHRLELQRDTEQDSYNKGFDDTRHYFQRKANHWRELAHEKRAEANKEINERKSKSAQEMLEVLQSRSTADKQKLIEEQDKYQEEYEKSMVEGHDTIQEACDDEIKKANEETWELLHHQNQNWQYQQQNEITQRMNRAISKHKIASKIAFITRLFSI